ncbi:PREDICTED: uncharacterized protein LOC105457175 [Wasmannia auropunctata]|uniref:uncharacterized protein LOC105457175 n=1 Tax=Wasmannia auropunctata TaxID=64793 RepID=UPI0005EF5C49|nr:PREDICTED: uncharacterized protein LOC105457175 [Wasmannia auropunctata]
MHAYNYLLTENTFIIQNQEIIPLHDYVHLQKGVRNNLLTKDLLIKNKDCEEFASWNDIIIAYEMDKYSFFKQRQLPKLTDKHVFPELIPKMKVKYATQVLSHTLANFIDVVMTLNQGIMNTTKCQMQLPQSATGKIILFFDELFDSFNGQKE